MKHSKPDKNEAHQQVTDTKGISIDINHIPEAETKTKIAHNNENCPHNSGKITRYERSNLIILIGLLIVTTIYALFSGLQWYIMNTSMKLDQRAWVGVITIDGKFEINMVQVNIKIKNTGKTPAKNVTIESIPQVIDTNIVTPNFANYKNIIDERHVVFPQQEIICVRGLIPSKEIFDDVKNGGKRLYIHGIIHYDDIFGIHHWATFCYYYIPGEKDYTNYKEHNDTDDN